MANAASADTTSSPIPIAALRRSSDKPTLLLIQRQGSNLFLTVKPAGNNG